MDQDVLTTPVEMELSEWDEPIDGRGQSPNYRRQIGRGVRLLFVASLVRNSRRDGKMATLRVAMRALLV